MSIQLTEEYIAKNVLRYIEQNLVTGKIVDRDIRDDVVRKMGDIENVEVLGDEWLSIPLDNWGTVSFIFDGNLAHFDQNYLEPCGMALAHSIDQTLLYNAAFRAGHRVGTPGLPSVDSIPVIENVIVGMKMQSHLLKSQMLLTGRETGDTAKERASFAKGMWQDQMIPDLSMYHAHMGSDDNGMAKCLDLVNLGEIGVGFAGGSVVMANRPMEGSYSTDGLSLKVEVIPVTQAEIEEKGYDKDYTHRVTMSTLFGVAIDPDYVTAIYS